MRENSPDGVGTLQRHVFSKIDSVESQSRQPDLNVETISSRTDNINPAVPGAASASERSSRAWGK